MSSIRITERDRAIVRDVWLFRYVNARQIARLHFSNLKIAQRRLRALTVAGLLDRFEVSESARRGFQTWWYRLAKGGADLVAEREDFEGSDLLPPKRKPKAPRFLRHHSEVTDFRIWLREGVAASEGRFSCRFVPEYEEVPGERRRRIAISLSDHKDLIPDGVFSLETQGGTKSALFTLELDRGTEPLTGRHANAIAEKLSRYRSAFERRADESYCELFGQEFHGFRILCVVPDEKRRAGFLGLAEEADLAPLVWVAVRDFLEQEGSLDHAAWAVNGSTTRRALSE